MRTALRFLLAMTLTGSLASCATMGPKAAEAPAQEPATAAETLATGEAAPAEAVAAEAVTENAPAETPKAAEKPAPKAAPAASAEGGKPISEKAGFYAAFSPIFKPAFGSEDRLNASAKSFEGGLSFNGPQFGMYIGFRRASSTIASVGTFDTSTFTSGSTSGELTVNHFLLGFQVPFNQVQGDWKDIQVTWLLEEGLALFKLAGNEEYTSLALDLATGLGAHFYTGTPFRIDLRGLYRLDPLVTEFSGADTSAELRNVRGQKISGSLTGFELKVGVSILLL